MSRATHGVVSLAALDVRARPGHRAELVSQLLLGEVVRLLGRVPGEDWWRVEGLVDGYRGWVRGWGLVRAPAARARSWQALAGARVVAPVAEVRARPGEGASVGPLFLGSRVIAGRRRGPFRPVELPDARRGWVAVSALGTARPRVDLLERVRSLLGAPYHWGGRTALGLDCSAFTQIVLAEQGVQLPRDARGQFRATRPLAAGEEPSRGDLAFFRDDRGDAPTHVAVGLGRGWVAHCRGLVRMASLEAANPLYDRELSRTLLSWRRTRSGSDGRG